MKTVTKTVTKKELVDYVAQVTKVKRSDVKLVVHAFIDAMTHELAQDHRLEFRNFGVFEVTRRRERKAQNPKTLERVVVPPKRTVKFKVGTKLRSVLDEADERDGVAKPTTYEATPLDVKVVAKQPPAPRNNEAAARDSGGHINNGQH